MTAQVSLPVDPPDYHYYHNEFSNRDLFLNCFQPDAEATSYNPSSVPDSEDSDEGNGCNMDTKSRNQSHGSAFKRGCVSTETSQEELPITSWNELSIIERVGLDR